MSTQPNRPFTLAGCLMLLVLSQAAAIEGEVISPIDIGNAILLNTTLRQYPDGHFRLTDDIYLNESFTHWVPLGSKEQPFNGTLDGNGKTIYGLKVTTSHDGETRWAVRILGKQLGPRLEL